MSTLMAVIIAIAAVVIVAIAAAVMIARRRALRRRFGPEYEHTVASKGGHREAGSALRDRLKEHDELDLRPLPRELRDEYSEDWKRLQLAFVDAPKTAVTQADSLVTRVLRDRGYPVDGFDHQSDLVSVDHPDIVANYREGHRVLSMSAQDRASTEDMRKALICYRAVVDELLEDRQESEVAR